MARACRSGDVFFFAVTIAAQSDMFRIAIRRVHPIAGWQILFLLDIVTERWRIALQTATRGAPMNNIPPFSSSTQTDVSGVLV